MNVIHVNFTPEYRSNVFAFLKIWGRDATEVAMLNDGHHPSFVKVLLKSIMGKEGW